MRNVAYLVGVAAGEAGLLVGAAALRRPTVAAVAFTVAPILATALAWWLLVRHTRVTVIRALLIAVGVAFVGFYAGMFVMLNVWGS